MGSGLKEALRHLCSEGGRWSYAVFWKVGRRSPTLLVWGEGHYETQKHLGLQDVSKIGTTEVVLQEWETLWSPLGNQTGKLKSAEDPLYYLVNKLMINQVHIGGEGIVGRPAFTGIHEWILPETLVSGCSTPEDEELQHQVLAGIQTIAVIPLLPLGVVQIGSIHKIIEEAGFVNQVKSIFLALGSFSSNEIKMVLSQRIESLSSPGLSRPSSQSLSSSSHMPYFTQIVGNNPLQQFPDIGFFSKKSDCFTLEQENNDNGFSASFISAPTSIAAAKSQRNFSLRYCGKKEAVITQVVSSNQMVYLNQSAHYNSCPSNTTSSVGNARTPQLRPDSSRDSGSFRDPNSASLFETSDSSNRGQKYGTQDSIPFTMWKSIVGKPSLQPSKGNESSDMSVFSTSKHPMESQCHQARDGDLFQALGCRSTNTDECNSFLEPSLPFSSDFWVNAVLPSEGTEKSQGTVCNKPSHPLSESISDAHITVDGDLFDVLGMELKRGKCHGSWNATLIPAVDKSEDNMSGNVSACITQLDQSSVQFSDEVKGRKLDNGVSMVSGTDHLLDAVVSKSNRSAKQNSVHIISCNADLTRTSNSVVPGKSSAYDQVAFSKSLEETDLFSLPTSLSKSEIARSESFQSNLVNEKTRECSGSSGPYKSHINLWAEDRQSMKQDDISSVNLRRPHETMKPNRKRPRPGESVRPRPKDRQMIQDRVRDLREIIPNGAKCSIDALLERTIKHMLFLQSVTKHADKLKLAGDSKILSEEGGLLLKDKQEGGATWAFEVGSQSMVCPIIVEDLNGPRQMLVEMLCEVHGLFLEIADIIKGLGLTIMKGVMESRDDTIWARFVVEANRDVSRMDVFMSLVHLLEQTSKNSTALNRTSNRNMRANILGQSSISGISSPIPATGLPDNLHPAI